jgi:hypothetical protein
VPEHRRCFSLILKAAMTAPKAAVSSGAQTTSRSWALRRKSAARHGLSFAAVAFFLHAGMPPRQAAAAAILALAYRMDMTIGMRIPSITIMTGQKTRPSTSPLNFSQRFIF